MATVSLYREIIKRAWARAGRNPHLWLLGFFAALLGNGGELEFILSQFNKLSSGAIEVGESIASVLGTGGSNIAQLFSKILASSHGNPLISAIFIVFVIVLIWLVISCQGALIRGCATSGDIGKETLIRNFRASSSSFFPLLAIIISSRLGAFFIFSIIGIPLGAILIYFINPVLAGVLLIFVLGTPLFIIASLISKYAIAYHMLERRKWGESIRSALGLFFENWLVSIELAVILFFINALAGALIVAMIFLFAVPFVLLSHVLRDNYSLMSVLFVWVGEILAFAILLVLGSILATFQYSSWVELFLRIRKGKHLSKIIRSIIGLRDRYG